MYLSLNMRFIRKNALAYAMLYALTLFFTAAFGQETYSLPKVINPSPQSMAFTRYGDYPMAAYTGLTDISVPLHNISGRKLSLPMSISFHASGRMANEINGVLGIRWTFNCGGLVTRTMKGNPDEWNYLTPYTVNPNHEPSFDELYSACTDGKISNGYTKPYYDSELDIFSYALPNGKQGHFVLKNENGVKVPMFMPYTPMKISMAKAATDKGYFERIEITDVDGTKYFFGKISAATANAIETLPEWDISDGKLGEVPTAWYLTKVVSNDGTDELLLTYNTRYEMQVSASQHATIYDRRRNSSTLYIWDDCELDAYECGLLNRFGPSYYWQQSADREAQTSAINKIVPILSGVQFEGGSVALNYSNDLLSDIVFKREAVPYKKIKFDLSKNTTGDPLYHLDRMAFYGEDQNTVSEKYGFSYYEGGNNEAAPESRKDWWGNYSRFVFNLLPYQPAQPVTYLMNGGGYKDVGLPFVERNPQLASKITGMIKTITYPTGGNTEFVYEDNRYNGGDAAGIRISEIISRPVLGKEIHKTYKYGINENGYGTINEHLRPGSTSRAALSILESNAMHFWRYYTDLGATFPIAWPHDVQMGFRMREYLSDPYISFDLQGSQIKYDAVAEYVSEYVAGYGYVNHKTASSYSWGDNPQLSDFIVRDRDEPITYPRKFSDPQNECYKPVMTGKSLYKYANNQYELVKRESYVYDYLLKEEAWDMPTYAHTSVVYTRQEPNTDLDLDAYYNTAKDYHNSSCSVYGYGYRKYRSGSQVLTSKTVEDFTPAGTVVTQYDMGFETTDHFLRTEQVQNGKNEVVKTTYSYPKDFATISPYSDMVSRNILSPVIELVHENITLHKELGRGRTNYNLWQNNTIIQPGTIQKSIAGNALETEATINAYDDKGNILQVTGRDGLITTYIWGYNQKYPVAKIVGKAYADVVAQSGISLPVLNNSASTDAVMRTELQKLRTLSNCFVNTYTYKPLTGVTSETDPGGRITYYEYDLFGRLSIVRDKENNILKKYTYDYLGECTNCGPVAGANWQPTGARRVKPCELNIAYNSRMGQQEEKDVNPNSSTYNQIRWVDYYIGFGDPLYDPLVQDMQEQYWVNTSTPPRCVQISGQNTGEQEQEQVYGDPNPCSLYYHSVRWKNLGMNTNACPLPAFFTSGDASGTYYSSVCVSPAQPTPIYVSVPAGQFTSTISLADANAQAAHYAQTYADAHGGCVVPPINFTFINNAGGGFTIELTNTTTLQQYTLHSVNGANAVLQNLPQGNYNIYIMPSSNDWRSYEIGCNYFTETQGEIWVDDIPLTSSCNTITVNY
ncbi:DUF5977 domain-containing protein [Filimonas effusa]|uniref:DUF5977 domain-containing protein n=1 Tax=Filimonas effusa TaxID=2508721 RepID=A0A4Q1D2Z4_9BACT|nr:DUF5977 domain-containing protein [Filimonas effusa]RXK82760.1 hypothetical protein ESB13_11505 [Filimonas effusa]